MFNDADALYTIMKLNGCIACKTVLYGSCIKFFKKGKTDSFSVK